jgi:MscS family membrane protein
MTNLTGNILHSAFLGNSLAQWGGLIVILTLSVVTSRVVIWRLGKSIRALSGDNSPHREDLLVEAFEQPLFFLLILLGVRVGFGILTVSAEWSDLFSRIWQFLFTIAVTWMVSRLYGWFHAGYILEYLRSRKLDDQIAEGMESGIRALIWALGFIIALNNIGYDVTTIVIALAVIGLTMALAAQDTVANLFGGLTIFSQQPFRSGDRVNVKDIDGVVKSIGLRTTTMQDIYGQEVIVPNKFFTENPVRAHGHDEAHIVQATISLKHGTAPDEIEKLIEFMNALMQNNKALTDRYQVGVANISAVSIDIEARFGIRKPLVNEGGDEYGRIVRIRSEVLLTILQEIKRRGIEFAAE